jgi:alcohol dehydrogenase class IV
VIDCINDVGYIDGMTAAFSFPTAIVFGPGAIGELRQRLEKLGAVKPLVVTDSGLVATATFKRAMVSAPAACPVFSGIESNPTDTQVQAATDEFRKNGCQSVIGIGGGSALDVAKIVRLKARLPQWNIGQPIPTDQALDLAPFTAIPTTAGTGSEVGRSSVVTIAGKKRVIFHPSLLAKLVILDPELTLDLPVKLTAATGADALTHCIESFTSPEFHPLCDGIALEGIRLIANALPIVTKDPRNVDARGQMLVAATMGGIAFQKDLGAAHSLAHPLSAICGMHHGLANALVLPTVMRFNASRRPRLYERVGQAMGVKQTDDRSTIDAVESLLRNTGLTMGLRANGLKDEQLATLADQAFEDDCHRTNPVPVTRDDLYHLYEQAM